MIKTIESAVKIWAVLDYTIFDGKPGDPHDMLHDIQLFRDHSYAKQYMNLLPSRKGGNSRGCTVGKAISEIELKCAYKEEQADE